MSDTFSYGWFKQSANTLSWSCLAADATPISAIMADRVKSAAAKQDQESVLIANSHISQLCFTNENQNPCRIRNENDILLDYS